MRKDSSISVSGGGFGLEGICLREAQRTLFVVKVAAALVVGNNGAGINIILGGRVVAIVPVLLQWVAILIARESNILGLGFHLLCLSRDTA